jgi:hypothetical protein
MSFYMVEIHQKVAAAGRPGVTLSEVFIKRPKVTIFPKSK